MTRTIAVALPKGGVGKTTTAVNLAASLAVAEKRTLLVDLDALGAAGLSFGFTEANTRAGIFDVFNFTASMERAVHRTELEYLDVVPSNVHTLQAEERLARLADNRSMLKNALRGWSARYDFIILDCPPYLRGMTANALTAAHGVLVTVRSGHFSLDAVDKLFSFMERIREAANRSLEVEGILLTMHEPRTRVTDITLRELRARYGGHLFGGTIPRNTLLAEASFYGKPAVLFDARSRGSAAYLAVAREILLREERRRSGREHPPSLLRSGESRTT
ncbi:MAG: ParA family protein [Bacteroidota bacterium]